MNDFFRGDYMPHGHCYLWEPSILWTNVISDLVIATAYFSIPIALIIFAKRRSGQKHNNLLVLFAIFILSCGVTHIFAIYTIWNGSYGLHGIVKAITAIASALTAFVLFKNLENIIAIPTPNELKQAQQQAMDQQLRNTKLEVENKANSIFKFSLELIPTGVMVVNKDQQIHFVNQKLESIFEYESDELVGQHLNLLIDEESKLNHKVLVEEYMSKGHTKDMAEGRIVWGKTKSGVSIPIEVSLSKHDVDNETYTFASVVSVAKLGVQRKRFIESSRRMKRAVEATDVGIWEWNTLTNKVWFSPRLLSLLDTDKKESEIKLEDWENHIHPDDRAHVHTALEAHLQKRKPYDVVYRGRNRNKQYRWMRTKGDSVTDDKGRAILMSGTMTDIHDFHVLQRELESKNHFLDAVLDNSPSTIFIVDIQANRMIFVNNKAEELTGYSLKEIQTLIEENRFGEIVNSEDLPILKTHLEEIQSIDSRGIIPAEIRLIHKEGHDVWCLFNNSVYRRDDDGNPLEIVGAVLDVSLTKQKEEANRRLSKEFLDTFELAAVGIAHVSPEGHWTKVNKKVCDILGYEREELMKLTFQDITHPEDLEKDLQQVNDLLEGKRKHYSMEKRYKHKLGHYLWARLTVSIVDDESEHDTYFISVIEDISEEKALQNELLRSNQELEQFAYVASHDLKEPLRTIRTYTSYLLKDIEAQNENRVKQDKEFIDSATLRMTILIDDLLRFSRVGSAKIERSVVDLNVLVAQVIDDFQTTIDEQNAKVKISEDLPKISTDPSQIRLALQNVIHNALKFHKKDQPASLEIWSEMKGKKTLLIHVKDHGIGIDKEYQSQIFGLFKRLHNSEEYEGTGLGLAIVNKIMNRLGGDVLIDSTHGEGTVVSLRFKKF